MNRISRRAAFRKIGAGGVSACGLTLLSGCNSANRWQTGRSTTAGHHPMPVLDVLETSPGTPQPRTVEPRPDPVPARRPVAAPASADPNAWRVSGGKRWRYIVVHHSATKGGSAASFHRYHVNHNGWRSLGYHFVIPNGIDAPDGEIEVGPRWRGQQTGAHTGGTPGNEYNERGIGICLVGNFNAGYPTRAQLRALETLVADLAARYGIPAYRIIGHRDAPGTSTSCPGGHLARYVHDDLRRVV